MSREWTERKRKGLTSEGETIIVTFTGETPRPALTPSKSVAVTSETYLTLIVTSVPRDPDLPRNRQLVKLDTSLLDFYNPLGSPSGVPRLSPPRTEVLGVPGRGKGGLIVLFW